MSALSRQQGRDAIRWVLCADASSCLHVSGSSLTRNQQHVEQPHQAQREIPASLKARSFVLSLVGLPFQMETSERRIFTVLLCMLYTEPPFLMKSPAPDPSYIVNFHIISYLSHSGVHLARSTYPSKYPISPLSQETDVQRSNQGRRLLIFSLVTQAYAYATACGISHSSKQAKSHMTLKLALLEVTVFKMKAPKENIRWTEGNQVTLQANEISVVRF